jgi:hypothetical protein
MGIERVLRSFSVAVLLVLGLAIGGPVAAEAVLGPDATDPPGSSLLSRSQSADDDFLADVIEYREDEPSASVEDERDREALLKLARELRLRPLHPQAQVLAAANTGTVERAVAAPTPADKSAASKLAEANALAASAIAQASGNRGDLLDDNLRAALRDAVRPAYEEVSGSAIFVAMRDLKIELRKSWIWSLDQPFSEGELQNVGPRGTSGSQAEDQRSQMAALNRSRSAAEQEMDRIRMAVLIDNLIEEIKPWAIGLAGLLIAAYSINIFLALRRNSRSSY